MEEFYPTNPEVGPPRAANEAVERAWAMLGSPGDAPRVHWLAGPCLLPDDDDDCSYGRYTASSHEVWLVSAERVTNTALVHELVHASLLLTVGDADAQHESEEWGLVATINQELQ